MFAPNQQTAEVRRHPTQAIGAFSMPPHMEVPKSHDPQKTKLKGTAIRAEQPSAILK
ncbi:MAG: hypothetical protein AAAB35_20790 [Phyllobacterium sp.]|uniref:hypothetical protein n=1 Tax=Phyllobacterium sp. TaxID=1871046 RepID=UPI0030F0AF83